MKALNTHWINYTKAVLEGETNNEEYTKNDWEEVWLRAWKTMRLFNLTNQQKFLQE